MRVCEQCGRTFGADETVCPDDQTELSAYTDELIGTNVDRYVLVRRLGRGAMGTIYLGVHPVIRSRVAIKILNTAAEEDSSGFSRFVTEARSVNEIQHPNIVRIADFDQLADGRPYFVMEYLAGDSLRERMTREPRLSPEEAGEIVKQILEALQAAHDAGFVHRDLKPDNIFITSDGVVKLLDFGIAKLLDSPGKSFETQAGVVIGTPMYISPEQALGDHSRVGPWTDLYSLGVILYELYTGRSPFNVKTVGRLLMAHIQDSPIPPSAQCIEVSGALEKAILRCLEKEPEDRPQSATELLAEFTAASTEYVDVVSQTLPGSTLPQYDNPLFEEATRQASETDGPGDLQRVDASEIVPGARSSARGQLTGPISSSPRVPSPPARSALRIGTIVVTIAALIAVAFWSYRAFLTKGSSRIKKAPAPTASKPRLAPRAQPRGKLVVLQPFQADYISPMKVTNAEGFDIVMQTHEPLVSYEALTGQIHAMLAVKWQRTAQGYTFELRKGVRFHDGAPLTAKEAVRSLKAAVKSKLGSAYLSDVVEIKATGEMFLTIKVKQHSATFLVRLSRYPSFIGRPGRRFPVGTGPYRVRLWNKRIGAVMLEPFVGYWGGAPKLQSIVFKAEPDAVARASHLVQGSAHLATALPARRAEARAQERD